MIELGVNREFRELAGTPDVIGKKVDSLITVIDFECTRAIEIVYDQAVRVEIKLSLQARNLTPAQKRKLEERMPAAKA